MEIHVLGRESYALFYDRDDENRLGIPNTVDEEAVKAILTKARIPIGGRRMNIELYELEGRKAVFVSLKNARREPAALLYHSLSDLTDAAAALYARSKDCPSALLYSYESEFCLYFPHLCAQDEAILTEFNGVMKRSLSISHIMEHGKCLIAENAVPFIVAKLA